MNAKRPIYLLLFLGIANFNSSYAEPLDTVTDSNVRQVCERYHITEVKKAECFTSYQQLRQDQLSCEASELSKSQCLSRYNELLEQWKREQHPGRDDDDRPPPHTRICPVFGDLPRAENGEV